MAMTTVTVKIEAKTKTKATSIVNGLEVNPSSTTAAFHRQTVRERNVPLSYSCAATPEAAENIRMAAEMIASGNSRFSDAENMFFALDI